ncbi:NucA/NucB deoxyribonuclease domain-containing protein [Streptomyces torulosus]|uniref:NucA/NucB deoxyribonuclease domain-containing protein n=1 Tax=Streptomyces torulosus TaxID=68276 RepID=UPI0006EBD1EC|nr:NucA/NucB deoxyribonuclease domain-containing protein [Streptomyces torulosus]
MNTGTALVRLARTTATAAALTLLTAATTTASHADPATHDPAPENTVFVDAASLSPDELRSFGQLIPYAEYARSHGSKSVAPRTAAGRAPGDEVDLREECAKQAARAKTATGWIKSRFESCQKRPFDLVLRDVKGTTTLGRLQFDQWVLGFAYDGSRRVDYVASIENIWVNPIPTEDAKKWRLGQHFRHSINASESDADPKVTAPQTEARDELLGAWDSRPQWTLTYTSPDKGALFKDGNQQRVSSTVAMDLSVSSPSAAPYTDGGSVYTSSVRYDYAGPVAGKHKGTVFTKARVELVMSEKDPAVNESALHIYDALNRPERTFPSWVGKSVPGAKEPLHRVVDEKTVDDNREKSISECKKVWGNYTGTGLECDEYPFASTKEGSTKGDNRFSVRLITGTDNRKGGERLNAMYTLNRVLNNDPFYVKITK